MSYPPVLSFSANDAVSRARSIAQLKSLYILGAGGRNPGAETPFTIKKKRLGSDCIGFALWCLGLDRYQPVDGKYIEYPFYDGWINTDSMLMDVAKDQVEFEECDPFPGCVVVYPSIWKNGKMVRMGHIGVVVEVPTKGLTETKAQWYKRIRVIDCAGAFTRKLKGRAIQERDCTLWNKPDAKFVCWKRQTKTDTIFHVEREPVMATPKLGDRILKLDNPMMRGEDVKQLQKLLKITPDGWYGAVTSGAVKAFQLRNHLTSDGIVGPETVTALHEVAR